MRPAIIGLTTYGRDENERFYLPAKYIDAIRSVGGLPLLIPPGETQFDALLPLVDGLIFTGGGDIDPAHYDGPAHPANYMIDLERDTTELTLAQRLKSTAHLQTLPVLGICRGAQLLAVADGSPLIPHVPDVFGTQVAHRSEQATATEHPVELMPESYLAHILDATSTTVASWHHQAIQAVPAGWRGAAYAQDGLIEAIEHTQHPWMVAVQWHPELTYQTAPHQRLFAAFVEAARHYRADHRST